MCCGIMAPIPELLLKKAIGEYTVVCPGADIPFLAAALISLSQDTGLKSTRFSWPIGTIQSSLHFTKG